MLSKLKKYWRVFKYMYGKAAVDLDTLTLLQQQQQEGQYMLYGNNTVYNSTFGHQSYVGHNSILFNCDIGSYCSIGPNVVIGYGDHPTNKFSTSPKVYYNEDLYGKDAVAKSQTELNKRVTIKDDVWIGANVFVKNGLTVWTGAILGAGAVVLTDIPEYAIAVGVPAKIIRNRFDQQTIDIIKATRWWDNDLEILIAKKDTTDIKTLRELGK